MRYVPFILIILCFLILIPAAFAGDNLTVEQNCQAGDSEDILLEGSYYFDASNANKGNGTYENPYNTFSINSIKDNSAVYFAEGEYYFDRDASFSNISFYGENSQNTILNGNGRALTISGIVNFKNITLTNLKIINRNTLNASNTVFKSLIPSYIDRYDNNYGGGIYSPSQSANINIDNCTFSDNSAQYGGAIYMDGGTLRIINSLFEDNFAYNFGGAIAAKSNSRIFINNTRFVNDKSTNDAGGAIYILSSSLEAYNLSIINSTSTFGPAITALSSNLVLVNFTAVNNTADYDGGAIYQMYGTIDVKSSKFIDNCAMNGGALYIDDVSSCNLSSNEFTRNRAYSHAGAIYSLFNDELNLTDSSFENNSASFYNDTFQSSQINLIIGSGNYPAYIYNETFFDEMPSYYNSKDWGYVTSVKDQQDGGNCWAFSVLATLESCILKASGDVFDFSEENMKNLVALFSDYGKNWFPNTGGNHDMALGYLASWLGPVNESDDLYDGESHLSAVLNNLYHVQNILYLKRNNYTDNDPIKQAILKYGAVSTYIHMSTVSGSAGKKYHYYTGTSDPDHSVSIVGWDDSFYIPNAPGKGAWIAKNSWGDTWGNEGYFYVSYYDRIFAMPGEYSSFTFILNDTYNFDKNYQYEVSQPTDYFWYNESSIWCKNVFNATDNEFIEGVSTFFDGDTDWELYIIVNNELKLYKNGSSVKGYFTFNMDYPIPVVKGDLFEVEFKITGDGKSSFPIVEGFEFNRVSYRPNVSFVSFDGENWSDLFDFNFRCLSHYYTTQVACIKAFTQVITFNSTVKSLDIAPAQGNLFNLTAYVVDENNYPVGNGNVTFYVNGINYTASVERGIASLLVPFTLRENNIRLVYESINYFSSTYSTIYDVVPVDLGVDIDVVQNLNNASITVTLSEALNCTITINVNGNVSEAKTVNGVYKFNLTDLKYGNYLINVTFSNIYMDGENSTLFFVDYKDTYFVANDIVTFYGSGMIYNFTLFDEFGVALNNSNVRFTLDNVTYFNATDAEGNIFFVVDLPLGNHVFEVFFDGNGTHAGSQDSALISVIPSKSWINITGITYDSFNLFNISVIVYDELNRIVNVGDLTFTVNNVNYDCGSLIPMVAGPNNISVCFEGENYFPSNSSTVYNAVPMNLDVDIGVQQDFNNACIMVRLSLAVNESLIINVNGNSTRVKTSNGFYKIDLTSLSYGNYNVSVEIDSDFYTGGNSTVFFVDYKDTYFVANDIVTFYGSGLIYNFTLFDEFGFALNNSNVKFTLDNVTYFNTTDAAGNVFFVVDLPLGGHVLELFFDGDGTHAGSQDSALISVIPSKSWLNITGITYDSFNLFNISVIVYDELNRIVNVGNLTFIVNNVNYDCGSLIPFVVGSNNISVSFEDANYYSSDISSTYDLSSVCLDVDVRVQQDFNNADIIICLSQDVNESLIINVNGNLTRVKTSNGFYKLDLASLSYGNYNVSVEIDSDFYTGENSTRFFVNVKKTRFEVNDFTTVYNSGEYFTVKLLDELNQPVAGRKVTFSLNNYINTTDGNGIVGIPIYLTESNYFINISFEGDDSYVGCVNASAVTVISSIELVENIIYTYGADYRVYLLDKSGNPLRNAQVTFTVNNVSYYITTGNDGIAALSVPIGSGDAVVSVLNPQTGEVKSQTIEVLPRLVENNDVVMYYGANQYYKVRPLNDYGQAVGKGEIVIFRFRSIEYKVMTDDDGYASFKLSSKPGTFMIMAYYKGFGVSNNVIIKPTLITKDKSVKKSKSILYSAKLLNKVGKAVKGKKITFKFKGKKYVAKTNKKGIAKITIDKKYKPGKYKIVAKYGQIKSTSFITIKK